MYDDLDHIFDRPPSDLSAPGLSSWKRETFKKLAEGCEQNHGKAIRKYIKSLISEYHGLKTHIEEKISYFVKEVTDKFDGDIARDVAEKFGLIYAGGMLGIRFGLLPWKERRLLAAITKSYIAARALLPDDGVSLRDRLAALKRLRSQLPSVSMPFTKNDAELQYNKLHGYMWRTDEANHYVIKRESFNQLFRSVEQQDLVTKWLIEKQRITLAVPKKHSGPSEGQPKEQVTWPDGERRRSIEIVWKRKKKEEKDKKKSATKKTA